MYLPRIEPWRLNDVSTQVSEQQARQVAEDAREQDWKLPSFGKELFLGNFRLDLIHPQPKLDAAAKCTIALCPSAFMVSTKQSAVRGLMNIAAP